MTSPDYPGDDEQLEAYLPVYDTIPEDWEDAQAFLVEALKRISNAVNSKIIGFYLDEELLSGISFVPGITQPGNNPGQFRQVLRKVVDVSPLVMGVNAGVPHEILFDDNFTLIDLWVSGTDSNSLTALRITGNDVVMDVTNINITSPQDFDRAWAVVEYMQEL